MTVLKKIFNVQQQKGVLLFVVIFLLVSNNVYCQRGFPIKDLSSNLYGLIDSLSGKIILSPRYSTMFQTKDMLPNDRYIVKNGEYQGLIGRNGKEIIPCVYTQVSNYDSDIIIVRDTIGRYGLVNSRHEKILPFEYRGIAYDHQGYISAYANGLCALFNKNNEMLLPFEYESISILGEFIRVSKNNKYGLLKKTLEVLIPLEFTYVSINHGLITTLAGRRETVYNKQGIKIAEEKNFTSASPISDTYIAVQNANDGKWGVTDTTGNIIIPNIYKSITGTLHDRFIVQSHQNNQFKWGIIDKENNVVVPFDYSSISKVSEERAIVGTLGKFGIIDDSGNLLTEINYDLIHPFDNGFWRVTREKKDGILDINCKEVVPLIYSATMKPDDGVVILTQGKSWILYNLLTNTAVTDSYDYISHNYQTTEHILARKNGFYGFIDSNGEIIIPFEFEKASDFKGGYASVVKDGVSYAISQNGNLLPLY